jgi:DNA-binding GntR family transcriptional regulator
MVAAIRRTVGPDLEPVNSERLVDVVYGALRDSIVEGGLQAGEPLNLEELARKLGVSRTPIHHALAMLAQDGLVQVVPRRGALVATISPDDIREIMDVRRALELLACERAVERASKDDIAALRELSQQTRDVVVSRELSEREAATKHDILNLAFHQRLVDLAGNTRLSVLYRRLKLGIQLAQVRAVSSEWRARVGREAREHQAILQAVEDRDLLAMQKVVNDHIGWAREVLAEDMRHWG